ncbi:uncharacterized protein JCM6883_005944, partial [Sporobolomyces salmoneus]|uniref:uncharacterized protein n=1 Tax=Sporobolomyces salmoneus TaxID=183962 RepID=UPI00317F07A3
MLRPWSMIVRQEGESAREILSRESLIFLPAVLCLLPRPTAILSYEILRRRRLLDDSRISIFSNSISSRTSRSQVAYAEQQQSADWSSTEEEDEDDRTTQEGEDETDQYEAVRGGGGGEGFVPPSTMTLQELKDNGFVSSSEGDQEEDSDLEDAEEENRFAGMNSVRNVSAGSGRHLGYSGSSASSSSSEDEEEEEHEATHEYRHRR